MTWIVEPTNTGNNDDSAGIDCGWVLVGLGFIGGAIGTCASGPFCRSLCMVKCFHEDC